MRLLCLAFLLLVGCGCGAPVQVTHPRPSSLAESVVALVTEEGDPYCAGTQLEEGILTAAHCVEGQDEVRVAFYESFTGESWRRYTTVRVVRLDTLRDLALLAFRGQPEAFLAAEQPSVGEAVWAIGHPAGVPYIQHRGVVSSTPRIAEGQPVFFVDAGLIGGMSGGPIFNDYGELVGVVSFSVGNILVPFPHLGGVTATDAIRAFLEERG